MFFFTSAYRWAVLFDEFICQYPSPSYIEGQIDVVDEFCGNYCRGGGAGECGRDTLSVFPWIVIVSTMLLQKLHFHGVVPPLP